jgi:hypothetical protein
LPGNIYEFTEITRSLKPKVTSSNPVGDIGIALQLDLVCVRISASAQRLRLDDSGQLEQLCRSRNVRHSAVAKSKHWSTGFICQNFLSSNNSETEIQPILAYKFNDKLALAIGDMQFKYDWNRRQWAQLPLGIELDYIADLYGQKIQFFANPQYNFVTNSSSSGWTVFVGLTLLAPGA